MKKWVFRTLTIFSSLLLVSGIGLGVGLSYSNKENVDKVLNNQNIKQNKVMFDNQQFSNINDAYDYAKANTNQVSLDISNKNIYSLDVDNQVKLFDSMIGLNNFVNNKINIIENCNTNIIDNNLDPVDNSIYVNDLYKYNVDISTNKIFENNLTNIYKKNGGGYVIEENDPEEAIRKAKESYLEIHKAFYFNGIYFKSKQDLEIYIRNVYVKKFTEQNNNSINNNNKYKKIYYWDELGNKCVSQPIDFSRNVDDILIDISNFVKVNNYQYLRVYDSNTSQAQFLKYNKLKNEIEGNLGENISITNLPILKKLNNDNKDLYVIDAKVDEEYELYGPYFLNTDSAISKITDCGAWKVSNDSPYEVVRSEAITLISSFLDLFLTNITSNKHQYRSHKPLFYISEINNEIYEAEDNLFNALSKIKTNDNSNLLNDFYQMYNNLQNTKSYCTIYAIPVIYNYLKDQLIINNADPLTVLLFKTYFDVLSMNIQAIFEGIFGDLLNEFNNKNGKRFNFAQFFGINIYGFDGSNIGSILNGNNLIKYYKPLLAGCYVFMKAIANSQNVLTPNYNSENDDFLYNVLEEGKNADQNTASKIKSIFINSGICKQLDTIYKTFSNWSNIISDNLFNELNKIQNVKSNSEIEKLNYLKNFISQYKNNNINNVPQQVFDEFSILQESLNVKPEYLVNNKLRSNGFKICLTQSYLNKQTSNLEVKIKAVNQASKFISKDNSSWTNKDGIFSNNNYDKSKIINNLSQSISASSYEQIIQQTTIINQVNITKNKDLFDKLEIAEKISGEASNIASNIINLIKDVNNDKFAVVKDQIIAAGVMSICASITNIASMVTSPPINLIVKAASFVFSFISAAIGQAEVQIYEYQVDEKTKYYWDGGLVMKRFWGLWNDKIRGIEDLKMQSPIQIIRSVNKDILYFDNKQYEVEDDGKAKKDAIKFILNEMNKNDEIYNMIKAKFSWVYSLEANVNNVTDNNAFSKIYSSDPNQMTLSKYAMNNKTTGIDGELFLDGYCFANKTDLEENLNKYVLKVIKPFYIAKIPNLDINKIPLDNQEPYHVPYPYFEPANSENQQLVCANGNLLNSNITINDVQKSQIDTDQDQEYIMYNANDVSNLDSNQPTVYNAATINDIFSDIKKRFLDTFEVATKKVLKTNLLQPGYEYFDSFETNLQTFNIYFVEIEQGIKKYFINKLDAENYIFKTATYNNSIKLDLISKNMYVYKNKNNKSIYFESLQQFNKWFIDNTKVLSGGN